MLNNNGKTNIEQKLNKLETENKKLTETVRKLEERVENLSILFFHLKDEMVKNNAKCS